MAITEAADTTAAFIQPKPWIRWGAVVLAVLGWYASLQMLRVSAGGSDTSGPFMRAVCGGSDEAGRPDGCTSVLTSPQAYVPLSSEPGAPRMPVSALGMGYFAFVALWYLFVGPPTRAGRYWHVIIVLVVLYGAYSSLDYIRMMAFELQRWCGGCLFAHAVNGGLLILTLWAWPWRRSVATVAPHPSGRLAVATIAAGGLACAIHLTLVLVFITGSILQERTNQYAKVLNDPEFILWDFERQPVVSLPMREDEPLAGLPTAANTVVLFSDFQCEHCRTAHEMVARVLEKYPDRLRAAYRYYPQDPACNAEQKFRVGGHASGCRAARAAEAVRLVGGPEACARMRRLLYERQRELPQRVLARQSEEQRGLFEEWAFELGVERSAFIAAFESAEVAARVQADIELANELGISAMPVVYLNGKRLRNWSKPETWDALLGGAGETSTQPTVTGPTMP
ncbi:MAG: thioredoxin domain-containing protein [Planctomycetota bacterium]